MTVPRPIGPYPLSSLAIRDHDPAAFDVAARVAAIVTDAFDRAGLPGLRGLAPIHVGSSAVAGLPGKGIVDLVILVEPAAIDAATEALVAAGFERQSGADPWPPTRPLVLGSLEVAGRTHPIHLHVTPDPLEVRQLVGLRDALRAEPALRDAYAALKRGLVEAGVESTRSYTYRKSAFIRATLARLGPARPAILPPATIGVLGGGQLGRMLGFAARALGYGFAVLDPDPACPAAAVADHVEVGAYHDVGAALRLAARADVVTIELEHIAPAVVDALQAAHVWTLRPGRFAIRMTQDRLAERRFLDSIGVPVAPWREVRTLDELGAAVRELAHEGGFRLKAALGGYDGRSQVRIGPAPAASELGEAFGALERSAAAHGLLLEREVDFRAELSVVVGRGVDGIARPYQAVRNIHDDGILVETVAPAPPPVDASAAARAAELASRIAVELDVEGVMTAELFLARDGSLLVNELAPRVHNSGHWTIDAARTSQFEQHVRAICGLPLGSPEPLARAAMVNLLGSGPLRPARLLGLERALDDPAVSVHLYDKRRVFERRKMGHVTATGATTDEALGTARRALAALSWADGEGGSE